MSQMLSSATLVDSEGRRDLAVPRGTTVVGLLAMLRIDPARDGVSLTGADGRPLDPGAAIGADLPAGSVLALTPTRASASFTGEADAENAASLPPVLLSTLALLVIGLIAAFLLLAPASGFLAIPEWARLLGAGAVIIVSAIPLSLRPARRSTVFLILLSLLFGVAGLAFVPAPIDSRIGSYAAPVAMSWTALVGASAAGALLHSTRCRTIAAAWACLAIATTLLAFFGVQPKPVAPLILAAGVTLFTVAPSISVRIPETQLLDLPRVTTAAAGLRSPEPPPPSTITRRRVLRTLDDSRIRADVLILIASALILASAPPVFAGIGTHTWHERAALVIAVCTPVLLLVDGRDRRGRLAHALPRILAGILVVLAVISSPVLGILRPTGGAVALLLIALGVAVIGVLRASASASPLLGRAADIVRTLAHALLIPCAVFASGIADVLRQVAS